MFKNDFGFIRMRSETNMDLDEDENVLVNPSGQHLNQAGNDPSRDPLVTIPDPSQSSKSGVEQEVGVKSKIERTPSKTKSKGSVTAHLLRTPDKQGTTGRSKFGWPNPNEGKAEAANNLGQVFRTMSSSNVTPRVNRTTIGRANSCSSECTSAQNTPTKSVSKPPHPGYAPMSTSRYPGSHTRTGSYAALSRGVPASSGSLAVVNTAEVPHFDLKEDPSFWMDHNVQVLIRVRPLNNMEKSMQGYNRCVRQESSQTITWIGQPETRFTFDHVACETIDQEMLFKMAGLPMVENCISGYNSCMFAYGQTGSGKTHTMLGEVGDFECRPSPQRGMTPRIFEFLFARIKAEEESRTDEKLKYSCKCSFLEIYNEQITDLLDPSSTNLLLREDVRQGGVYVENLSEFEVQTVGDILKLLAQGSANRKVAATNLNRESSRSHSVFMCVVECKWERDSTTNMRFARLNLVDLAGSERQKTSGAEGERLKEAASINKSLSTLGHVIMVLVDLANGKMRHVPYRDSRLTFLLQDSLGGNSKTMIIANISPSICCAAETLNTLKFAQRAKLIQNNAVVNEDSSGDVTALQYQIRLLKEEICALRRQNVSRSLSFGNSSVQYSTDDNEVVDMDIEQITPYKLLDSEPKVQEVSTKQVLSLETMLAGALRREQMAEESLRKLEAEIEQLNHLVYQREEEARCAKMMLKFREDKIQRMESLLGGAKPVDAILSEENAALHEEIEMLQAKIDRNPEVTRFARESIKLSEQLRRFQDFYEEGERDILLGEVSELRDKLIQFLEEKATKNNHLENLLAPHNATKSHEDDTLQLQLDNALNELEKCQGDLKLCLENNMKLTREVDDLRTLRSAVNPTLHDFDTNDEVIKGSIVEVSPTEVGSRDGAKVHKDAYHAEHVLKHNEDFVSIELELDILKIIMKEEQLARQRAEELLSCLSADLKLAENSMLSICNQYEVVKQDLKEAKSIIEAFESQQLLSITEMEVLRQKNEEYLVLLQKQDREMMMLKEKICAQEPIVQSDFNQTPCDESSLEMKLNKMQASLDKAKRLNMWYQSDYAVQLTNQEEMEEVRRQVEAETAEVIVCLQEELSSLQHEVQESFLKEIEADNRLVVLECSLRCQQETLKVMSQENTVLKEQTDEKEKNIKLLVEDWETFCSEIEDALSDGHVTLNEASEELNIICSSFSEQRRGVFEKVGKIIKRNTEQEVVIEELNLCLEDANSRISEMDGMLVSLKGAALAITQSHQQVCDRKENEILNLRSDLSDEASKAIELARKIEKGQDEIRRASTCATVAFLIVARLSDVNAGHLDALRLMDIKLKESKELNMVKEALLHDQGVAFEEAGMQIQALRDELAEKQRCISVMQKRIEENVVIEMESKELNLMKEALLNDQAVALEEAEMQIQAFSNALAEKERCISLMQKRIEENDVEILKTREQLSELILGVSSVRSCMDEYTEKGYKPKNVCEDEMSHAGVDDASYLEESEGSVKLLRVVPSKEGINNPSMERVDQDNIRSANAYKDYTGKDATIILLRKEIESAMNSLKGVRAEMACLISEKKEASVYEKQSREGMEIIKAHVCNLQASFVAFEDQCLLKLQALDKKLLKVEESAQETSCCWSHAKEWYQCELSEANESAAQKAAEASCIFANFAQAQDAMRDADVMINGLMIVNETIKLEVEGLKNANLKLSCERDLLVEKLESLLSDSAAKQEQCDAHIQELDHTVTEMKRSSKEVLMSLVEEICLMKSQSQQVSESVAENYMIELSAKELELLFMASEFQRVADQMADIRNKELSNCTVLEYLEREIIILAMSTHLTGHLLLEKETEVDCLREEADKVEMHLDQCFVDIIGMEVVNTVYKQDLLVLWELKSELDETSMQKEKLLNQIQSHEEERGNLIRSLEKMEKDLEVSSTHSLVLDQQNKGLQDDIITMQSSLQELRTRLEEANQSLQKELDETRREKLMLIEAVEKKELQVKSSSTHVDLLHSENSELKESIQNLESTIQILQENLDSEKTHLIKLQQSQSYASEELHRKSHDLQNHVIKVIALQEENNSLTDEVRSLKYGHFEALGSVRCNATEHLDLVDAADMTSQRLVHLLNEQVALLTNQISIDFSQNLEVVSKMTEDLETLECIVSDTISENMSLQSELYRKDEILKGLQFDLSLLQEAATDSRDQKDEIKNLLDSLESAEDELERRSHEVNEAIAHGQELETRLNEKIDRIYLLEKELSTSNQYLETLSKDNAELRSCVEELSARNDSVESELMEKRKIIESLENEILDLENSVNQMNDLTDSLKSDLHDAVCQRDQIQKEMILVEEKLDTAQALGEEHEATAAEAQEIAESRRIYAEEKEEEVKLLEKSVQELDDTINVLENKVDILRGEAERQRLQREDLELELQSLKNVMQNVRNNDADIKSHLEEKENQLKETLGKIEILQKDLASKDAEIAKCKAHISELNLHAEAQASEYKTKFKALEAMVEQVKPEGPSSQGKNTSANKVEKTAAKPRGSGSPFKCIGMGLVHQLKLEKDEELTAERIRIQELETLAADRQKEIFVLNSRLAAAESMTHDVIRDLLGVKLDMSNYVSFLDGQQLEKITENTQFNNVESVVKDVEMRKLKEQLKEFIDEREGWLDEIDKKQSQLIAAQLELEKLRQKDRSVTAENDMLKAENTAHKKRVTQLEEEVNELSGQQNLQLRVHHHAKTKEENKVLKMQNEELNGKLQRAESFLSRVREELARYRSRRGRIPSINIDDENRLSEKLKDSEQERIQLAQRLLSLCTSILKVAGIDKPSSEVDISSAEGALDQLRTRIMSLERELENSKLKCRLDNERTRLSELFPQRSPASSRADSNCPPLRRSSRTPLFSADDR